MSMIELDFSKFTPEDQERLRSVQFGIEIEHFLDSLIGRYLVERAETERAAALEDLAEVDPHDYKQIMALQMVVKRCDSFGQWLADKQIAAANARAELEGDE